VIDVAQTSRSERGAVTVVAVLALFLILGVAALAVDLGMLHAARTQLSIAADAAALAGVKELAFGSRQRAFERSAEYAARNEALGEPVLLNIETGGQGGDVVLGTFDFADRSFRPEDFLPNAVRVTARRSGERAVPTFFAAAFGHRLVDVSARATAVGYPRTVAVTIDRSASMAAPPFPDGEIAPAREAAAQFIHDLAASTLPERAGVISYASAVDVNAGIRGLHDAGEPGVLMGLTRAIEAADPGQEGGTNTGEAIEKATQAILDADPGQGRDGGQRMIVLLSDGLANRAPNLDCHDYQTEYGNACWRYAVEAAREAYAEGIVVHTIALGDNDHYLQMQEIAAAGGNGLALFAPTPAHLTEMFETLSRIAQVALVD
jgi:von Willebrand factor type A domain/Putative Flp pilus-assembly TadE/G-like